MATLPCPCGFQGHPRRGCSCTAHQVNSYRRQLSGPLLDRFDLFVDVPPPEPGALLSEPPGEGSAAVRERVQAARQVLAAVKPSRAVAPVRARLEQAVIDWGLSGRGAQRALVLARTIAALDGRSAPRAADAEEALSFRRGLLDLRATAQAPSASAPCRPTQATTARPASPRPRSNRPRRRPGGS